MAIKKHEDIRLNVKPMFLTLYHEYVFEGPCRFGEGMQLEKEFDLHMAAEKFKGWYAQLQAAMPADVVNLLEPVKVERDEQFLTKDEMIEKLAEGSEDVDLYYIGYARNLPCAPASPAQSLRLAAPPPLHRLSSLLVALSSIHSRIGRMPPNT